MKFTKINSIPTRAEKVSGRGALYYNLWCDENKNEYIQLTSNVGGGGFGVGSFSDGLYRIDDINMDSSFRGYDALTGEVLITNNYNMSAFLRAVKTDVLQRRESENQALTSDAGSQGSVMPETEGGMWDKPSP